MGSLVKEINLALKNLDDMFTHNRLVANIIAAIVYFQLADFLIQVWYERFEEAGWQIDLQRIARCGVIALLMGCIGHFWYLMLDTAFPSNSINDAIAKVGIDQILAGAFFCSFYIFGMGILEGYSFETCFLEWKHKFPAIYKTDWLFWPFVQIINFMYVSAKFRLLYVNIAGFLWNIFLSWYRHRAILTATRSAVYIAARVQNRQNPQQQPRQSRVPPNSAAPSRSKRYINQ